MDMIGGIFALVVVIMLLRWLAKSIFGVDVFDWRMGTPKPKYRQKKK
jgi:hypothetical protein